MIISYSGKLFSIKLNKPVQFILTATLLYWLFFQCLNSYASNDWNDQRKKDEDNWRKKRMSLCSINHIQLRHVFVTRDSDEELGRGLIAAIEYTEIQQKKRNEMSQNILDLYSLRIENKLGINTSKIAHEDSFPGMLDISVTIRGSKSPSGDYFYTVTHDVELNEKGLSRYGREGSLLLMSWSKSGNIMLGIAQADMEAINLVPKIVNEMDETFKRAKEYCIENNLFDQKM